MLNRLRLVLLAHVAGFALMAAPATAQPADTPEQPAEEAAAANDDAEIVYVTAQRRQENVQKVSIAITAIAGNTLDTQGIQSFGDLGFRVPSLRFGSGVTGGEHVITLRGQSSQNTTSGGESPIAYSVDGVYMARSTVVDDEFFDIERVEVLRGPQGTLYGRNSVGGSVNIITAKPDDELAAYADVKAGDYDAWTVRAWMNMPLVTDTDGHDVYARVTAVVSQHDPYQENDSTLASATENSDAQEFYMIRGQLLWELSPSADLLLQASTISNGKPVATKLAWGTAPLPSQARFIGQTYDPDPRHTSSGFPEEFDKTTNMFSGTLNWDWGFATLTSITAYQTGEWFQTNDADSTSLDIAHLNYWTLDSDQFSQEVRLASNGDDAFRWLFGAFYFNENVNQGFEYVDTGLNAPFGTGFVFTNGGDIETTSYAFFGQIDYTLPSTPLTITLGARYTHDTKHVDDFLNYFIPDFPFTLFLSKDVEQSWSQATYNARLAYQFTDDVMGYVSVSTGYLAGGELMGNFPGLYDPETVTNYEAGFKSTFSDGRVLLNAAIYRMDIKDMQVFVQDITGSRIDNAGKAYVEGLEAEAVVYPVDGLRINAALTLTDAKYEEYITIDNRIGVPADFAGHRLIQTPEYTFLLGAEYAFDTSIGTITPRADIFWSGDLYFLSANTDRDRQDAYTLVNLNVSWVDPDERWMGMIFVNNVGDEDVISNDGLQSNTIGLGFGIDNYTYYPPQTFGVRLGVNL